MGQRWKSESVKTPDSDDPVRWPSLKTYWGAFKRQAWVALLVSLPVLLLVIFGINKWTEEYASMSSVVYDISKERVNQDSSRVIAGRLASKFNERFADPEFLNALYLRMIELGWTEPAHEESLFKKQLKEAAARLLSRSPGKGNEADEARKRRIDDLLLRLKPQANPDKLLLSITAHARTPEDAQMLAREALRFFVEEDLKLTKLNLDAQRSRLSSLENSTLQEKANPQDLVRTPEISEDEAPPPSEDRKAVKAKEQNLIAQIVAKQREYTRAQAIQYDREFTLQNELNALLSKRGQAHPEVVQKRREIEKFRTDLGVPQLEADINRFKTELGLLQVRMKAQGIPIDRSVQISGFSDEVRRYLLDLSNQIRDLDLEIDSIEKQIEDPSKWVRYVLVRDAELPSQADNTDKLYIMIALGAGLVLTCFFLVVIVRELWSPMINDQHSFDKNYGIPVLMDTPPARKMPFLTVESIRRLRAQLGELKTKRKKELLLLDSYRYLQEMLKARGNPQVVCFFDLGLDKSSSMSAANLANVMATDSSDRVILLSFNPDAQKHLPQQGAHDLMEFLAGEVEWKDCRIKAEGDLACDLAVAARPELQLGQFREDLVQRLIKALRDKYQRIIIDGLNPMFVNENSMLGRESDAILLRIRPGATRKADLDRILIVTAPEKIQGTIFT